MTRLRRALRATTRYLAGALDLRDTVALVGLASLAWGLYLIFPPAGFIGVGVVLLAGAARGAR